MIRFGRKSSSSLLHGLEGAEVESRILIGTTGTFRLISSTATFALSLVMRDQHFASWKSVSRTCATTEKE